VAAGESVERRIVTVLFADLVGFTPLSESLDAEDVRTIQRAYFAGVRETVGRHGGVLEKFVGDAAMAVFGIPSVRDDDAERAVRAALALTSAVELIGARLGLDEAPLQLRVGVNTGEVVYEPGQEEALVTGDPVNVAARLQTAAPAGGVLLGDQTALAVADAVELEPLPPVDLKGKSAPVPVARAVALRAERSREHAMGTLRAPLLGRDAELAELRAAHTRALGGEPERWLVLAPPGTGKSRLVDTLAEEVPLVWRARLRPDVLAPYDAVAQLFVAAGEAAEEVTEAAASEHERESLFADWLATLDRASDRTQALWLVEDVHWAAPDLLAFLELAGRASGARLVLTTARPALAARSPDWCASARTIELPALERRVAEDLVRALVGDALPADVLGEVAARSDGNPLFIEELLRMWIGAGTLEQSGDGAWSFEPAAGAVPMPLSVQAVYAAQLDDLPAPARDVARLAAVAGRRVPTAALEALGAADGGAGIDGLRHRAFVIGPVADRLFGESFVFRHALLRDAAYASLTRAERSRLHVRFARWLESVQDAEQAAEVVGRHYAAALENSPLLADDVEGLDRDALGRAAGEWFERAAGAALRLAAHDAGRELALRSLEHTPPGEPVLHGRRLTLLGEATAFGSDMDEGARRLDEACEALAPVLPEGRAELAEAASLRLLIAFEQTRFGEGVELATRFLDCVGDNSDPPTARVLLGRARCMHGLTNRLDDTAPDCERVLEIARRFGDRELELDALIVLVAARMEAGVMAGPGEWAAVESLARELGRWRSVGSAILNQRDSTSPREALALIESAVEVGREHGLTELLAWSELARSELLFESGDWDAALASALRGVEIGDRNGYVRAAVRNWFVAVPIAAERRDRALLQRVLDWLDSHGPFPPSPYGLVMRASIAVAAAQNGLTDDTAFDGDTLIRGAEAEFGGADWFAAAERVAAALLARGERDGVAREVAIAARWNSGNAATALGLAHEQLLRAWLGEEGAAQRALQAAREAHAPWWILRALDACGQGDSVERHELARRLGVAEVAGTTA
jgi:class 3 adenylate cyclase